MHIQYQIILNDFLIKTKISTITPFLSNSCTYPRTNELRPEKMALRRITYRNASKLASESPIIGNV